ncbi:MAG: helix-turn-helix transcriptional regulator [Desulfitobacteriaceae bacterium]|nr:helix-turn-helix transcriptional regulator [Desulfitobacteriaceae bacterium]MDI6915353.1 helix-turn-helix transcriptional regulator [Desulfitobacteriaceae bacterium]
MAAQRWGTNLYKWRLQRGYTRVELAAKSGLSVQLLAQLEKGQRKGTPNQWLKLAQTLGVEVHQLLSESRTWPDDLDRFDEAVSPYKIQIPY